MRHGPLLGSLFDFGTDEFWDLTHRLRRTALAAKAEQGSGSVVFTNCYSSPHDDSIVSALESVVTSRRGESVPVFLECGLDELRRRVTDTVRVEMRKIHTVEGLHEYIGAWNFVALDRPDTMRVSTEGRSPEECAEEIASAVL